MTEKQVAFRLDEELHRRLQMYAMQKNESVKEVMEEVVKQLLRGGQGIRPRMLKVIHQKFREQEAEIKKVLKEAYIDSIRLNPADKGTVIQVIISEFGEIRTLETQKGMVPPSVIDLKAYLLYEFECITDVNIWCEAYYDEDVFVKPLEGNYIEFIKWLMKHKIFRGFKGDNYMHINDLEFDFDESIPEKVENELDDDDEYPEKLSGVFNIKGEYREKYVDFIFEDDYYEEDVYRILRKDHDRYNSNYLNYVYRWNPTVYLEIMNIIRKDLIDGFVNEEVEKAWNEISCREELELNFE